jgi:hypothetical protein
MRQFNLLFLSALTLAGCAQTDCEDADCATSPDTRSMDFGQGFEEARRAIEADGTRLPEDADRRVEDEIEDELRDQCVVLGIMATRWTGEPNDFDGVIFGPGGRTVADVDGRFAPFNPDFGVLAGGYTVTLPMETDVEKVDRLPAPDGIGGPIGGVYRGNHSFTATIARGTISLPIRGMWKRTSPTGGYALGVILNCDDEDGDRVEPTPIEVDTVRD